MPQQLEDEFDRLKTEKTRLEEREVRKAAAFVSRKRQGETVEVKRPWWFQTQDEFWYEEEATLP